MAFVVIGIVSALNLILIVHKFKLGRIEDGVFDVILFSVLTMLFAGSYAGMVVAMVSSLIISIYLLISPPKFFHSFVNSKDVQEVVSLTKKHVNKEELKKTLKDLKFD